MSEQPALDPAVRAFLESPDCLDKAEKALELALKRQEPWAICFVLEGLRYLDTCIRYDERNNKIWYDLSASPKAMLAFKCENLHDRNS